MSRPLLSTSLPAASPAVATAQSHRNAVASAHPADDSTTDALDSNVTLFSSHHDAAAGNVLALAPFSSLRLHDGPSSAAQKCIRSPAAAGASTARMPSSRPRKRVTCQLPDSSPRNATRAISAAIASAVAVIMPPAAVPTPSPPAPSVDDVFSMPVTVVRKRWVGVIINYVPKAGFLKWMRPNVFPWKKTGRSVTNSVLVSPSVLTYTPSQIAANC